MNLKGVTGSEELNCLAPVFTNVASFQCWRYNPAPKKLCPSYQPPLQHVFTHKSPGEKKKDWETRKQCFPPMTCSACFIMKTKKAIHLLLEIWTCSTLKFAKKNVPWRETLPKSHVFSLVTKQSLHCLLIDYHLERIKSYLCLLMINTNWDCSMHTGIKSLYTLTHSR